MSPEEPPATVSENPDDPSSSLQAVFDRFVRNPLVHGAVIRVEDGPRRCIWEQAAGNFEETTPYFIASTTKLYISAALLALRASGRLDLDDHLTDRLPGELIAGIHVHDGHDHTSELRIRHLMSHTSGIADYFQQRRPEGGNLMKTILGGDDQSWELGDVIEASRSIGAAFAPGTPGKALYSDTNYQLLGRVVEIATGMDLQDALESLVFRPLGLPSTYLYIDPEDSRPQPMYYKRAVLPIPRAMASFGPDGGIVSTAEDSMRFLRGFFQGDLFPRQYLDELDSWKRIFFPLQSGVGLLRFKLPRALTMFGPSPELVGHSGLSGAFAFYNPQKDVYLAGTVNQIAKPQLSFRLMMRILSKL